MLECDTAQSPVPSSFFLICLQEQLHSHRQGRSTGVGCSWVFSPLFHQFDRTTTKSSQTLYIPPVAHVQDPNYAPCVEDFCGYSGHGLCLQPTSVTGWQQPIAKSISCRASYQGCFSLPCSTQRMISSSWLGGTVLLKVNPSLSFSIKHCFKICDPDPRDLVESEQLCRLLFLLGLCIK